MFRQAGARFSSIRSRAHERPRALAVQSPGRERRRIQFASLISGARTQIRPSPCQRPWASVDPRSRVRASSMVVQHAKLRESPCAVCGSVSWGRTVRWRRAASGSGPDDRPSRERATAPDARGKIRARVLATIHDSPSGRRELHQSALTITSHAGIRISPVSRQRTGIPTGPIWPKILSL
eukprot:scaffold82051_cov54-Phaeocystis_antarctica.AAC.5